MIIIMKHGHLPEQVEKVTDKIRELGFSHHLSQGKEKTIIGVIGDERRHELIPMFENLKGVEKVIAIVKPFKMASREYRQEDSQISIDGVTIGGKEVIIMAGPCAVEGREQIFALADEVKNAGAKVLRGGAFKPRTSPYSFQGLGEEGLKLLREAKERTGLPVTTEVLSPETVDLVAEYADILQIGARNMQNFALLQKVGKCSRPVLLKRGMMNSLEELLMSAEYILVSGNPRVILCERGIRTFEKYSRFTLDISAVPILKALTHLPVIVDPSHAAGSWELVPPLSRAAIAAGADGLIIEVHNEPQKALSDGLQSLKPNRFAALMEDLRYITRGLGRTIAS
jgi:3-deoxy-7-phosphoheptulonate synthase